MFDPQSLFSVIERLPVVEAERWRIPGAVSMIEFAAAILAANDLSRFRNVGSSKAIRLLKDFERLLVKTADAIEALPAEAYSALEIATRTMPIVGAKHPLQFQEAAMAMLWAVRIARGEIPDSTAGAGRPSKRGAAGLSDVALIVFEGLTGTRATRTFDAYADGNPATSEFVRFVRDLFDLLEIGASAETQAREAIRRAKRSRETVP